MDINPNTGKGWTDAEEATFADIMHIARMGRIAAIHLFRRCKSDPTKAVRLAAEYGAAALASAPVNAARIANLRRFREARLPVHKVHA